ncbi:hypothetical protein [Anaerosporobacter faecicola]|uniref:hypothetical protein n=1 Tax=Anaerosporobacter faecicola TaxID=2718714 RepID=UPI00143BDBB6|nr:hypothetical protein [Anaerosporobacter faecicola]
MKKKKLMKMQLQTFADTMATGAKFERQWLLHYIDSSFGGETASYVRLGTDLEEYNIEMNADIETKKNILGETSNTVKGYEPSSEVETYYARKGDALYTQLATIVNNRSTGSALETKVVDILVESDGTQVWAYQEDAIIIPKSIGGDGGGVNIPFEIKYNGNRKAGTWNNSTKTFTETVVGE